MLTRRPPPAKPDTAKSGLCSPPQVPSCAPRAENLQDGQPEATPYNVCLDTQRNTACQPR